MLMRIALGVALVFSIAVGVGTYAYLDTRTATAKKGDGALHVRE